MARTDRSYIPAAGRNAFLPFYDTIATFLGADQVRSILLDLATPRPGDRVLDIGCGTGTFATLLKQRHPQVAVVGLDPEPNALTRARRKAERGRVSIRFDQGFSQALEYPAASFDLVFSSFMFHHLDGDAKEKTLGETRRVLKPGGSLYLLDYVRHPHASHAFFLLPHSQERFRDNSESQILALLTGAGFSVVKQIGERRVFFGLGRVGYYRGKL
jgi:ubiquinone/menaquinone biosynthesis C-methylase UbiE